MSRSLIECLHSSFLPQKDVCGHYSTSDGTCANGDAKFSIGNLYTGSAADYERPSLHAVGTGEGSQVYDWGLYASTKRGVAEKYAKVGASIKESLLVPEHAQKNGKDIRRYDPAATRQEDLSAEMIVGEAITAAQVLGHEIGHTIASLPRDRPLGPVGDSLRTLFDAVNREFQKTASPLRKAGDRTVDEETSAVSRSATS